MPKSHPSVRKSKIDSAAPWFAVESVTRVDKHQIGKPLHSPKHKLSDCALLQAAHDYVDRGLPITLCPTGSKVPFSKDWGNKVWVHKDIDAEFSGRGPLNVGLILGPTSGLIDIEIDELGGDAALLKLFEDDVPVTPQWHSARGRHRLFPWHEDFEQIGKASVPFDGLEIRLGAGSKAAHSLLPPSITNGWGRKWLISLDDCDPAPLPGTVRQKLLAMFSQKGCAMPVDEEMKHSMRHSIAVFHAVSQTPCQPQSAGTVELSSLGRKGQGKGHRADQRLSVERAIARAIQNTLPGSEGFRNKQLLQFARHLKAIPELSHASTEALRPIVKAWYVKALPSIGTKEFDASWQDFLVAWKNVKYAVGEGPLAQIYVDAMLHIPPCASKFKVESIRKLVAFCRQLQQVNGERPFWLSCRAAASLLGVSPSTAHRGVWLLIHNNVLELVKEGSRGRATEYRYLGD